jgi:hypothetical protein
VDYDPKKHGDVPTPIYLKPGFLVTVVVMGIAITYVRFPETFHRAWASLFGG